jgi:hypothetical protein
LFIFISLGYELGLISIKSGHLLKDEGDRAEGAYVEGAYVEGAYVESESFTLHTSYFTLPTSHFTLHTSYFILHTSIYVFRFLWSLSKQTL